MSRWVPFTAHIRVVPARGTRTTYIRDLQKIASNVYDEIVTDTDLSIASPGGGQQRSYSGYQSGGLGTMVDGMAIKPQMGQTPAQLHIAGFITSTAKNAIPVTEATVFHAGETVTGYRGNHHWDSLPTTATNTLVTEIKDKLDTAMTSVLGASADWKVFRIEVAGVMYGDRGMHFPN